MERTMHKSHAMNHDARTHGDSAMHAMNYLHLAVMAGLSFVSMYVLMYAMVDVFGNVFANLNQVYMAGLMTAPMVIIELVVMGAMYANKRLNLIIIGGCLVALALFFVLIRQQTLIYDSQFLRSMIPHHASAILMCEKASIRDPEIKQLCQAIISGQQAEIAQMKAKLAQME
jgi:hypothetical protein